MNQEINDRLGSIFARRSIRKYENRKINNDIINGMLHAAMAAPSACCKDPWRFIVVTESAVLEKIASGLPNGAMLADAGAGIVVCGDMAAAHDNQLSYMIQDCSAAIENILLASSMLGIGSCWLGVHPREERIAHLRNVCEIPEPVIPLSCIALGYPAENKPQRSRYDEQFVHHEKWNAE